MSIKITRQKICSLTGGRSPGVSDTAQDGKDLSCEGVEFDSRNIRGGELFVAIQGEATHGHAFVGKANQRGAALFLVESIEEAIKQAGDDAPDPERCIEVSDSLQAFWTIAQWWRQELGLPILAVTGSVGKTFTKDFSSALLLREARGGFSQKSFNNHTGVPYTLCSLSSEHAWGVLEMGMNHAGELASLVKLVEPQVAIITRVAPVHLEGLGSIEAVAEAKVEILGGLQDGGVAVLNADDALLCDTARAALDPERVSTKYFGYADHADCRIISVKPRAEKGLDIELAIDGETLQLLVPVLGKHNAENIAAAICAVRCLRPSISFEDIKQAASRFIPPPMRMNVRKLQGNKIIIDDSYNANPLAMKALMTVAEDFKESDRSVGYILGDMLELGPDAARIHEDIAKAIASTMPQFVVGVGEFASVYAEAAREQGVMSFVAPGPEAAGHIAAKIDFDVCMVKASRGVQLDKAVTVLLDTLGEVVSMPGMPENDQ